MSYKSAICVQENTEICIQVLFIIQMFTTKVLFTLYRRGMTDTISQGGRHLAIIALLAIIPVLARLSYQLFPLRRELHLRHLRRGLAPPRRVVA